MHIARNTFMVFGLALALGLAPGSCPQAEAQAEAAGSGTGGLSVAEAIETALARNLELQGVAYEVEAARARQRGASLLLRDNPTVTTSAGPRERDAGGDSVDWGVAVEQRVEIAGQRGARIDAADAGLRAVEARFAARRSELAASVREAFGDAQAAQALSVLADDDVVLARQALTAAEARFEAGDAAMIEVNTARIELGRTTSDAAAALQARHRALSTLKLLLGLPGEVELTQDRTADKTEALCRAAREPLLAQARAQRGDLAAAREELAQAQAELRLADRDAIASPSFGVSYNREEDDDIVQAIVSVPLPIFDRNQAAKGSAAAQVSRAKLALQAAERALEQDVDLALTRCAAARAVMDSYGNEILDVARRNLDLASEGYRAGKLDFLQLLLIRREVLGARRAAIESVREWNEAVAQLQRATGALP